MNWRLWRRLIHDGEPWTIFLLLVFGGLIYVRAFGPFWMAAFHGFSLLSCMFWRLRGKLCMDGVMHYLIYRSFGFLHLFGCSLVWPSSCLHLTTSYTLSRPFLLFHLGSIFPLFPLSLAISFRSVSYYILLMDCVIDWIGFLSMRALDICSHLNMTEMHYRWLSVLSPLAR